MNSQVIQAYYTTPDDQTAKIIMAKNKKKQKNKKDNTSNIFIFNFQNKFYDTEQYPDKEKTHDVARKAIPIVSNIYYPPNTFLRYSSFVSFPIFKSACNDKFSLLKS